jgi:lipopolysaccharide/colanic/teichoic acid biosynthesis glycosyltransferase
MLPASSVPEIMAKCRSTHHTSGAFHRVFDVLCAVTGLFLLSPLFCLIALAIKLDDGGPVFYQQVRVGRCFRPFRICKFRSMVTGADRAGPLTAPGDSRVTRVGRWLRTYKLDELPQLFNVFKGDMQLVGARPEVEHYVQMFHPQYVEILRDRPGITDPASLAYRHEEQMLSPDRIEQQYVKEILPAKIEISLSYQKQRSFLSDTRILARTVFGLLN